VSPLNRKPLEIVVCSNSTPKNTTLKSVYVAGIELNVKVAAALVRVVVAIGS
jgi:hypothetical protein